MRIVMGIFYDYIIVRIDWNKLIFLLKTVVLFNRL